MMGALDDWTTVSVKGLLPATGQTTIDIVGGLGDAYISFLMADAVLRPPAALDDPNSQIVYDTTETWETSSWQYEETVETWTFEPDDIQPDDDWGLR